MRRVKTAPRPNWQKIVESQGMYYHTLPNYQPGALSFPKQPADQDSSARPYWDESAYYHFERSEIDALEECTYRLNDCCLQVVQHVIDNGLFEQVGIPAGLSDWIAQSWERDEHTIYGRFDLSYDGTGPPKLLEYNADTPTGLLEAAVIQWFWLKDCQSFEDQFNSIHERLIEVFQTMGKVRGGRFYFTALAENLEDFMTVNYLRDCAIQAGWDTAYINLEDIGWHEGRKQFADLSESGIRTCFKLYPWEWMTRERFGSRLLLNTCNWFEPPWKMVLSNKGMLVLLREQFPDCPYLLEASFEPLPTGNYVRKPIHGREGNNIAMVQRGTVIRETGGDYDGPCIYQELSPLPNYDGNYPVIGSWIVNGYACGIGVREDTCPITQNTSRFVPHVFSRF